MSDFFQNGVISTLHLLRDRPIEAIEEELAEFAKRRPMTLVLPSLFSELEGEALPKIVQELRHASYIHHIVVGLDQADAKQFEEARRFFSVLPQRTSILWHDGPKLRALDQQLAEQKLEPRQPGKGRNVWYCFGYVLACDDSRAVALHDCDITTYSRQLPARLFYPVAAPSFSYSFCKGFYPRLRQSSFGGRVARLFVTPLLRSLLRILGPMDYLVFLDSFRYPLAGEFSMRNELLSTLRMPGDWSLEIGLLSEAYRNLALNQICQVGITHEYDHKHQPLSRDDPSRGLSRMSMEIAKAIYRKLATEGATMTKELFRTIKATYYRHALDMLRQHSDNARLNGLTLDLHAETLAIEVFAESIIRASDDFLENPLEVPFITNWSRVFSALPGFDQQLLEVVESDNGER